MVGAFEGPKSCTWTAVSAFVYQLAWIIDVISLEFVSYLR